MIILYYIRHPSSVPFSQLPEKRTPEEQAKSECIDAVTDLLDRVRYSSDVVDGELEELTSKAGGKKTKPPELVDCERRVALHRAHVLRLEQTLRLLENDLVTAEQVTHSGLLESMAYFIDSFRDADYSDDLTEIFETLPLHLVSDVGVINLVRPAKGGPTREDAAAALAAGIAPEGSPNAPLTPPHAQPGSSGAASGSKDERAAARKKLRLEKKKAGGAPCEEHPLTPSPMMHAHAAASGVGSPLHTHSLPSGVQPVQRSPVSGSPPPHSPAMMGGIARSLQLAGSPMGLPRGQPPPPPPPPGRKGDPDRSPQFQSQPPPPAFPSPAASLNLSGSAPGSGSGAVAWAGASQTPHHLRPGPGPLGGSPPPLRGSAPFSSPGAGPSTPPTGPSVPPSLHTTPGGGLGGSAAAPAVPSLGLETVREDYAVLLQEHGQPPPPPPPAGGLTGRESFDRDRDRGRSSSQQPSPRTFGTAGQSQATAAFGATSAPRPGFNVSPRGERLSEPIARSSLFRTLSDTRGSGGQGAAAIAAGEQGPGSQGSLQRAHSLTQVQGAPMPPAGPGYAMSTSHDGGYGQAQLQAQCQAAASFHPPGGAGSHPHGHGGMMYHYGHAAPATAYHVPLAPYAFSPGDAVYMLSQSAVPPELSMAASWSGAGGGGNGGGRLSAGSGGGVGYGSTPPHGTGYPLSPALSSSAANVNVIGTPAGSRFRRSSDQYYDRSLASLTFGGGPMAGAAATPPPPHTAGNGQSAPTLIESLAALTLELSHQGGDQYQGGGGTGTVNVSRELHPQGSLPAAQQGHGQLGGVAGLFSPSQPQGLPGPSDAGAQSPWSPYFTTSSGNTAPGAGMGSGPLGMPYTPRGGGAGTGASTGDRTAREEQLSGTPESSLNFRSLMGALGSGGAGDDSQTKPPAAPIHPPSPFSLEDGMHHMPVTPAGLSLAQTEQGAQLQGPSGLSSRQSVGSELQDTSVAVWVEAVEKCLVDDHVDAAPARANAHARSGGSTPPVRSSHEFSPAASDLGLQGSADRGPGGDSNSNVNHAGLSAAATAAARGNSMPPPGFGPLSTPPRPSEREDPPFGDLFTRSDPALLSTARQLFGGLADHFRSGPGGPAGYGFNLESPLGLHMAAAHLARSGGPPPPTDSRVPTSYWMAHDGSGPATSATDQPLGPLAAALLEQFPRTEAERFCSLEFFRRLPDEVNSAETGSTMHSHMHMDQSPGPHSPPLSLGLAPPAAANSAPSAYGAAGLRGSLRASAGAHGLGPGPSAGGWGEGGTGAGAAGPMPGLSWAHDPSGPDLPPFFSSLESLGLGFGG